MLARSNATTRSQNLRSSFVMNKSPASNSSKSPDARPNTLLATPAKSESKYVSAILSRQRPPNNNAQDIERSTRDLSSMK